MSESEWTERAASSFGALRRSGWYSTRTHLFGRRRLFRRDYETLWPFAGAWSAVGTLASVTQTSEEAMAVLPTMFDGLRYYHRRGPSVLDGSDPVGFESFVVPPLGPGGDVFYDDNAWLGLALVHHHDLTEDRRALVLARRLLRFVISGWSTEPAWVDPGGIRWKVPSSNRSRNTCSNGPVAELAALLHLRTGDRDAGAWAARIYNWVRGSLLSEDGLYADRMTPEGAITPDIWSYNQGTMIGAGVLLHRVTREHSYLAEAEGTARAAVARFRPELLMRQDAPFNAVFFRNLLLLDQVAPQPDYRAAAAAYGDAMWHEMRDPSTGLFRGGPSFLNNTAPMVEIYALLAGAPPHA